ncbi:hypothetical protein NUU61_005364 [Penicillium alfredii]|uniref:Cytidyltransferase-like domain-containing protein n=1 Tax=Penicillium alfredii TaxID=1506179 RepID=A0A9W9F9D7_9EURO|nr:uncharacterized protein NUU61_005364 [Penicillium alfredii]KAJ5096008.1 hypothetical protein NUU61_005364 [Penicillium alfredii]
MASNRTSPSSALLLLPPPPSFSFGSVKDAFEPSVSDALTRLSEPLDGSNHIATLDLALAIPDLLSPSCRPRARVFATLQHYLTSIYTLIGAVCAARNIELDSPGGIDARVVFVDYTAADQTGFGSSQFGPILDLQSLATSKRSWDYIFHLNNTTGKALTSTFVSSLPAQSKERMAASLQAISSKPDWTIPQPLLVPDEQQPLTPHYSVAVGGTFDHLHVGHKLLLTATMLASEPLGQADPDSERLLTVGVSCDALLANKKYAEVLESWEERFQGASSFLTAITDFSPGPNAPRVERVSVPGPNGNFVRVQVQPSLTFKFVEISDPFGPTITEKSITALVVSKETHAGGIAVNGERAKQGWKGLAIFEVDVLHSGDAAAATATDVESFDSKISSTEIRRRRMDRAKV